MIFKRDRTAHLSLTRQDGQNLQRRVDPDLLQALLEMALRHGGAACKLAWERTGVLGTRSLGVCWPPHFRPPSSACLRAGGKRFRLGMALHLETPDQTDLEEFADDVLRFLSGQSPLQRFDAEPVTPNGTGTEQESSSSESTADPSGAATKPHLVEAAQSQGPSEDYIELVVVPDEQDSANGSLNNSNAPVNGAAKAPLNGHHSSSPDREMLPEEDVADELDSRGIYPPDGAEVLSASDPHVEILPPSSAPKDRINPRRRWHHEKGDVFTVAGPIHPTDMEDQGLDVRVEDLEWLNPGDRLISDRRGRCVIESVQQFGRRILLSDTKDQQHWVTADELVREFYFDDGYPMVG